MPPPLRLAALALLCGALGCDPGSGGGEPVSGPLVATVLRPAEATVEIAPGTAVGFAGSCSVSGATHAWDFGAVAPGRSAEAAPGDIVFPAVGRYDVSYRCAAGAVEAPPVHRAVVVRAPRTSEFQLEVRFLTTVSDAQRAAFEDAAARVRAVIVGAVAISHPRSVACGGTRVTEDVDGLLILVRIAPIDGPGQVLGQAGPCALRGNDGLPSLGEMVFDSADLDALERGGRLRNVVLHEMLHVVGFGTVWEVHDLLSGAGQTDPRFRGVAAAGAWQDWNGGTGATVPVENTGGEGTRDAHWREQVFGSELMTGWVSGGSQPLSRTTVASLSDLGYGVEPLQADDFTVAGGAALDAGPTGDDLELIDDVLPGAPVVVD